ncbi:phage minor head protein [Jeotgalibacillus malaysiensis]|uniref:phage minor head protein n=1 Tax=Jeotgalibacillus malaysiensis TaxID=1508404 RepID=UPI00384E6B12
MSKINQLIQDINEFIQKSSDSSISDVTADYPGIEFLDEQVEQFEKKVAKLLRNQRKYFIEALAAFVSKDEDTETLGAFLSFVQQNLFAEDEFAQEFGEEAAAFLSTTIKDLTGLMMDSIDKDVQFEVLSQRTVTWIEEWSEDLGELMQLNSHNAVEKILSEAIQNGDSIADIELKLKDLPEFDRARARRTAITEVLTASSRSQWESYMQSPAVIGKRWKHSGSKGINPRQNHMELDGTVVGVDELFVIPGSGETCQYPRDISLTARERVNCHCALGPVTDESILGLTKEEKEEIRQQVLLELNA